MNSSLQPLQSMPTFFIALLSIVLLITLFTLSRLKLPYPPGPRGLPVIGNMLMMDQLTHRGLARLARRYGGLLHLKMGGLHMVAVSTPDMAREVLQAQDNVFSNRPATVAISYLSYDRADMAFAHYGPFWRQMRKICVMKLFSPKHAESWRAVTEEVDWLVSAVSAEVGSASNIGQMALALTRNITFRAAFGTISGQGQEEFVKIMQEFSKLFGAFNMGDFIPWLGWVHGFEFKERLAKARGSLDGFIDRIIDDHMAKEATKKKSKECLADEVIDTDMVDEMMAFYSEDDLKSDSEDLQSIKITRNNIKALIMVRAVSMPFSCSLHLAVYALVSFYSLSLSPPPSLTFSNRLKINA